MITIAHRGNIKNGVFRIALLIWHELLRLEAQRQVNHFSGLLLTQLDMLFPILLNHVLPTQSFDITVS